MRRLAVEHVRVADTRLQHLLQRLGLARPVVETATRISAGLGWSP